MSSAPPEILYIVDPMCSWCWGFSPVVQAIHDTFGDHLTVTPIAGGLRPGTTGPMDPESRATVLHHWADVGNATGQPFQIEDALPGGFVYDTEPPCRALVTMREVAPEHALRYLHDVQEAFYAHGRDVTQSDVLTELAQGFITAGALFAERFESDTLRATTHSDFERARSLGISAFPAVLLNDGKKYELLTLGYRPFDEIKPRIVRWLETALAS